MAQPFRYEPTTGRYIYDPSGSNALRCMRVATATTGRILEEAKPTAGARAIMAVADASRAAVEAARAATPSVDLGGWIKWAVVGLVAVLGIQAIGFVRGR